MFSPIFFCNPKKKTVVNLDDFQASITYHEKNFVSMQRITDFAPPDQRLQGGFKGLYFHLLGLRYNFLILQVRRSWIFFCLPLSSRDKYPEAWLSVFKLFLTFVVSVT